MASWHDKAHAMIQAEAWHCYCKANMQKNGRAYAKHHPYTLPQWCKELMEAMGRNDEETAKAIICWEYLRDY